MTVQEVAKVVGGGTPSSKVPEYWGGDVPWLTPKDLSDTPSRYTQHGSRSITQAGLRNSGARMLPRGAVLLTSRAPVGYVSVAGGPLATNQGFKSLVLQDGQIPEFWYYLLSHSTEYLQANSGGSTFQEISGAALKALRFTIPPIDEQRRIVDLIGALDDTLTAARSSRSCVRTLLTSGLSSAFRAGTCTLLPFTDVAEFASGATFPPDAQGDKTGPIPFIKVSDMNLPGNETHIASANNFVTEAALKRLKARSWPAGTVVFPKVGAALLTEKRRVLTRDTAFDNNVMGVIAKPGTLPAYLFAFMRTVKLGSFAQSGAVPSINQGHLRELRVPARSLLDQDELCGRIGSLDTAIQQASKELTSLERLRSHLLTNLLSGEHEIPESYDELMEV